jgi:hypothetical protein
MRSFHDKADVFDKNNKIQSLSKCRCGTPNAKISSPFALQTNTTPLNFIIKHKKSKTLVDKEIMDLSNKHADSKLKYKLKEMIHSSLPIEENYFLMKKMHLQKKIFQLKREVDGSISKEVQLKQRNYNEKIAEYAKISTFMNLKRVKIKKTSMEMKNSKIIFKKIADKMCFFLKNLDKLKLSVSEVSIRVYK